MRLKKMLIFLLIIILIFLGGKYILKKYVFPYKYTQEVNKYSTEYNLDPLFVLSVIKAESGFKENAKSQKDAVGLMQITGSTGNWIAEQMSKKGFTKDDLYNPDTNIEMGCWYLNNLSKEFGDRQDLIISAYNAGRGNVNKWLKDTKYSSDGKSVDYIPFKETKNYVDKVNIYYKMYKLLYT